ncbi:head-tail joining protein [Syntrophotalea acetylenica]|uniref:Phage protein n=1 Tax=Syntrophotalea acetylenica TaxID=29542 RepID=A0A1L3GDT4_SYNAC|nr:hypothetical protein [Syntrophotalea acetylenica]APG24103.1 hypothetical protein A7E75_02945 [Syntrophotalea acetylenica]APG44685.1 hypothetical protein A6070_11570 [Syntrophotalea acetylenica]
MIDAGEVFDLALGDWGETVMVGGQSITAIFDVPFAVASPRDYGVESSGPLLVCKTTDLPAGTDHGTAIAVRGKPYTVAGMEDNGLGDTVLTLVAV